MIIKYTQVSPYNIFVDTFSLSEKRSGTKLENTSLSADVFQGSKKYYMDFLLTL